MNEHHDKFSPSRLAQLDNCLDWESGGDSDAASYGTMMHALIANIAQGNAVVGETADILMAGRAVEWLRSIGDLRWSHETWVDGFIPETGGTIDAWSKDYANRRLLIVDWKGSLPLPNSMQGKAYALNLFMSLPESERQRFDSIDVMFYNYMTGDTNGASYTSEKTLAADISALLRRYSGQMVNRRAANPGCSYCRHSSHCEVALSQTTTELTTLPDTSVMPLPALLAFYDRLKAVMKRAEALESAAKARLMDAARAGELPGYTVKLKRGNKVEWASESDAAAAVQRILDDHFATAKVTGLLPPGQVKAALKAAGVSLTQEDEGRLTSVQIQNSYETLAKEKA